MSKITDNEIDKIADKLLEKLKNDKDFKVQKILSPFQKTEKLLFELKYLKGAIEVKNRYIKSLKNDPVLISKKEIGVNVQESKKYLSEMEKIENQIEKIEKEIERLQIVVEMTEKALDTIREDKYFKIIEMKYFEELTFEYISEVLEIGERTAKRHKNRLITKLRTIIFSDDAVNSIIN
ncbi:MAG: hypothetical protein Q4B43_05525 [Bacteroidota bacterium]|nr:hypothetical protein [Bacteroidota bacterium]